MTVKIFKYSVFYFLGLLQIAIFLVAVEKPAHAYVDPGSGLLMFQVGGSMLAGALFVLRTKIRRLFGMKSAAKPETDLEKIDTPVPKETRL
jgi:hypothetical protein